MSNFFQQLCLAIKAFGGVAINIDYGYCNYDFSNSLQVIVKQQKVPFLKGCLQGDITALVDFNHLGNIAKANQLEFSLINKAKFLLDLGIIQRAQQLLTTNPQQASNIAKDVDRLIGDIKLHLLTAAAKLHLVNAKQWNAKE
jgi:NADH dehydrogenase [ubiquinone] 1 alpha subcomplex assembly factor 7